MDVEQLAEAATWDRGGFGGVRPGSTALSGVARARRPVLVVRGAPEPPSAAGRVQVGAAVSAPTTGAGGGIRLLGGRARTVLDRAHRPALPVPEA